MERIVRTRRSKDFVRDHQASWERLDSLVRRLSGEGAPLSPDELDETWELYQMTSSHYAHAETVFPGHEVTKRLREIVVRAHNVLYGATVRKGLFRRLFRFVWREFPDLVHERFGFVLAAFLLFFAGSALAFAVTWQDFENMSYFLPAEFGWADPEDVGDPVVWDHALVSAEIMVNNILVAFKCFAYGILLGIGTVYVLFYNGMLLGSLSGFYMKSGVSYEFFAFIWPHGIIELTAVFISGAAGLAFAWRLFVPGDLPRKEALIREGLVTVKLAMGIVPMLVVAGLIEGYITPLDWPHWTKYLVAFLTLVLLVLYFGRPFLRHGVIRAEETKTGNAA
ncbi:stage II sporulation protein M [Staphylospora marina]|uniref:stage II sporulation protein M n=1 Tax=Staphylospora marina TaxID=2490858 RepID=UPI0013DDB311|nr:stage II sporulation protein M [Staphylospora marina]